MTLPAEVKMSLERKALDLGGRSWAFTESS
jgi:hypothetical protein